MVINAAMKERLIHHTAADGYVSYGRDGGQGRDIVIGPSKGFLQDCALLSRIRSPETTVVTTLEEKPDAALEGALDTLMTAWEKSKRGNLSLLEVCDTNTLRVEFQNRMHRNFKRFRVDPKEIDQAALDVLHDDVCRTLDMADTLLEPDTTVSFLLFHYPPSSEPVPITHNWHNDVRPVTHGKIAFNRSPNITGVRFKFKEQADEDLLRGVGFSTGRTVFKIGKENIHRAASVSKTRGRVAYILTGQPRFAVS